MLIGSLYEKIIKTNQDGADPKSKVRRRIKEVTVSTSFATF